MKNSEAPAAPSDPGTGMTPEDSPISRRADGVPIEWTPAIQGILKRVTLAGCLAMVYVEFTGSAAQVEYARSLGATEFHFGVLGAIPSAALLLQFLSAFWLNRLRYRKRVWIPLMTLHRLVPVAVAIVPYAMPAADSHTWVWTMLGLLALSHGLGNLGVPMWFGWMADLLPPRHLAEYWSMRRRAQAFTSACALLASAGFFWWLSAVDIRVTFLAASLAGAAAGVADILLFIGVPEPPNARPADGGWASFTAPFRDAEYRPFIVFSAYWSFAATWSFPFFRLYMLTELGLSLPATMALFLVHALGGALFTANFGRLIDKMGQRPVIILCTALKSGIVLAFLFVTPASAAWVLAPVFVFDNIMNTGLLIGHNGYVLRESPRENRGMYVAAVQACSGLAGAAAALIAGDLLQRWDGYAEVWMGMAMNHYHLVFAIGIVLRLGAIAMALRIREPRSQATDEVLIQTVMPAMMRWMRAPAGFFSREQKGD
ncbi:MAG: MFS transporter [Planctomycetes bacterium]|nr:MFS transporter [Planctomycetota bacterium]